MKLLKNWLKLIEIAKKKLVEIAGRRIFKILGRYFWILIRVVFFLEGFQIERE